MCSALLRKSVFVSDSISLCLFPIILSRFGIFISFYGSSRICYGSVQHLMRKFSSLFCLCVHLNEHTNLDLNLLVLENTRKGTHRLIRFDYFLKYDVFFRSFPCRFVAQLAQGLSVTVFLLSNYICFLLNVSFFYLLKFLPAEPISSPSHRPSQTLLNIIANSIPIYFCLDQGD